MTIHALLHMPSKMYYYIANTIRLLLQQVDILIVKNRAINVIFTLYKPKQPIAALRGVAPTTSLVQLCMHIISPC